MLAPTQVARAAPHPTERRFALPEGATTSGLTLGAEQALRPPAESVLKTSQNKRHAPGLCAYYVVFLAPMTSRAVPEWWSGGSQVFVRCVTIQIDLRR